MQPPSPLFAHLSSLLAAHPTLSRLEPFATTDTDPASLAMVAADASTVSSLSSTRSLCSGAPGAPSPLSDAALSGGPLTLGLALSAASPLAAEAAARLRGAPSPSDAASASAVLVLVRPAHYTAWNARKSIATAASPDAAFDALSLELRLSALVLSAHPKVADAWEHRRWALRRMVASGGVLPADLSSVLERELAVCDAGATHRPRNYLAWCHRGVVVDMAVAAGLPRLALADLGTVQARWICGGAPGDGSAWHHRVRILAALERSLPPGEWRTLLDAEAALLAEVAPPVLVAKGHSAAMAGMLGGGG